MHSHETVTFVLGGNMKLFVTFVTELMLLSFILRNLFIHNKQLTCWVIFKA